MFEDMQVDVNDLLLYIAELYIRNMKNIEKISLLKEQLSKIKEYEERIENLRRERDNAIALANSYEGKIFELNDTIRRLEAELADYKSKKRTKK